MSHSKTNSTRHQLTLLAVFSVNSKLLLLLVFTESCFQGDFPVPPPYSVATSLPTYDEAEKAKAAAMAASAVEVMPRVRRHSLEFTSTRLFHVVFLTHTETSVTEKCQKWIV